MFPQPPKQAEDFFYLLTPLNMSAELSIPHPDDLSNHLQTLTKEIKAENIRNTFGSKTGETDTELKKSISSLIASIIETSILKQGKNEKLTELTRCYPSAVLCALQYFPEDILSLLQNHPFNQTLANIGEGETVKTIYGKNGIDVAWENQNTGWGQ